MLPQENNPLLDFSGLPRFAEITPAHVTPAMDQLLADGRATTAASLKANSTWDEFVAPLEDANERIGRAWGQVAHLHAVMDNPELREVYNANLPKLTQYWTELGQNLELFQKYKALRNSDAFAGLSPARPSPHAGATPAPRRARCARSRPPAARRSRPTWPGRRRRCG